MRLQAVALPHSADGRRPHPELRGQRARAPVRGSDGLVVKRPVHDARFKLGGHAGGAPGARRIVHQGLNPAVQEALAPQGHLASVQIDLGSDVLVLPILRGQQHDPGSLLHAGLNAAAPGERSQLPFGNSIQFDLPGNAHGSNLRKAWYAQYTLSSIISSALH